VDCRKGVDRSERKNRACLVISLIFLVWNIVATCVHLGAKGYPEVDLREEHGRITVIEASPNQKSALEGVRNPVVATVKQRFLLGRRVNVNKASMDEINGLPGISDKVAKAVVDARATNGTFHSPEDLLAGPGIKEKRLKKILPFLTGFNNN
jgi:competence ComEA-like helix-hairpin-helix protein